MKTTLINMIASIVRHLVGSDLWSLIVIAVLQVEETGQSGTEKREAVITGLRAMTSTVAGWLVNLAIEAAVAKLKVTK
jgi:hypothetical protein